MKKLYLIILFIINSLSLIAAPTLNGPTGLITMPTAHSLHYKEFSFSYDYLTKTKPNMADRWAYSLNLGTFENLEIGAIGGKNPGEGVFLNIKYFVSSGNERFPLTFAVGFENLSSYHESDFYLVVSKQMQSDFSIHGGFKGVFSDTLNPFLMAGCEYNYTEKLRLLADVNGEQETYYLNTGLSYNFYNSFSFRLYLTDLLDNSPDGRYISSGIAINKLL